MNFYRDPLLDKLRSIESRPLQEGLSDDEFAELQKLRAELGDDPESSKLHAEVDDIVKQRAAAFEKPPQGDKPQDDEEKKWPSTRDEIIAFQKANGLTPDGLIGKKTLAALTAAGYTPPPGFKPVGDRVKPTPTKPQNQAPQPTTSGTPPELAKVDTIKNKEYWVNGTRYAFTGVPGGKGSWFPNFEQDDWIGTPANRKLSREKYTGPVPN